MIIRWGKWAILLWWMGDNLYLRISISHSSTIEIHNEIYKDKYWQSFEQFRP
jgi:hypothetical protein